MTGCEKDNGKDVVPEQPLSKPQEVVEYKNYEKTAHYYLASLKIPTKWYLEERDNGFNLIENKTGTEIVFAIEEYDPNINNIKYEDAKNMLSSDTNSFVSFQKTAGNQLFYKYYSKIKGMQYAVCEVSTFNFKYTYTLRLVCEERFYEQYYPVYAYVVDSLQLSTETKTVPAGYNALYYSNVKLLTFYPRDWKITATNNYYATSYSGTTITVTFANPIADFAKMDKNAYTKIMQKTVANFTTASISNQKNVIIAEGYYTDNSVRYVVLNTIYNFEKYSINIVYVSPESECAMYLKQYEMLSREIYPQG